MKHIISEDEKEAIIDRFKRERSELEQLRDTIIAYLESYKKGEGRNHIHLLIGRPNGMKSIESIIDKINRYRLQGKKYGYEDVDDLVGVRLLCPYDSDIVVVSQWLARQELFQIQPSLEEAKKELDRKFDERGYRGLQFFVTIPSISKTKKFELQLQTILAEAWDAWTHDIQYKRRIPIGEELNEHMTLLGRMLYTLDQQGELLRSQILAEEKESEERRWAAAQVHLSENIKSELFKRMEFPADIEKFDRMTDTDRILKNLERLAEEEGLTDSICRGYALLALLDDTDENKREALNKADKYREGDLNDPARCRIQASVYWSLGHASKAAQIASQGIAMIEKLKEETGKLTTKQKKLLRQLKNQFVYFICDCKDSTQKSKAKGYLNDLTEILAEKDTKGYFKIVFGEIEDEIEEGRRLIRETLKEAEKEAKSNPSTYRLVQAFYKKHERYALNKLMSLLRQK